MPREIYDDETLMAYADGVLDEETSARIDAAIAADADLADRVAGLAAARDAVRTLHDPLSDLPVPPELTDRIRAMAAAAEKPKATVVDLSERRNRTKGAPPRERPRRFWPMALVASLAAVLVLPVAALIANRTSEPVALALGAPIAPEVAGVLDRLPSGETEAVDGLGRVEMIASFKSPDGTLCREFSADGPGSLVAVACRGDAGWRVAFAVETTQGSGYAPAGALAALDAYLSANSAGEPLSAEAEAEALSAR